MTLAVYPSIPKPSYSYNLDHQLKTMVTDMESGNEQRNRRWRFPRRTFILLYNLLTFTTDQRDAICDFYYQRYGSYDLFWFFDFQERRWIDQYMGRGDGITQTFDLPGITTASLTVPVGILTEDGKRITTETGDVITTEGGSIGTMPTVYIDGVDASTILASFSFGDGIGEGGADQISFDLYTPAIGSLITCDFTGYLRIKGRFKDDKITEEIFTTHLDKLAVSIYEVKN